MSEAAGLRIVGPIQVMEIKSRSNRSSLCISLNRMTDVSNTISGFLLVGFLKYKTTVTYINGRFLVLSPTI